MGLQNASSYYLTFFIDGQNKGGVPPGDKSTAFAVAPGSHALRADALIGGKVVSASRTVTVGAGQVRTWTITN